MKICSKDPRYGVAVCDGMRYTCEPGGFIEVADSYGETLLKQHPDLMVYGTKPKAAPKEEAAPVDPLSLLDPPAKKRGRPKAVPSIVLEPEEEIEEAPEEIGEVDPLAALEEGIE